MPSTCSCVCVRVREARTSWCSPHTAVYCVCVCACVRAMAHGPRLCSRLAALTALLAAPARRSSHHKTAGILVIGDEILKGEVTDTNSHYIARHLFELGVKVTKIAIIRDDKLTISKEIRSFSDQYTYVITTGGVGPTHDDVTYEGVAMAFGENLKPHPELIKIITGIFNTEDLNSPAMKFANVPESAQLTYGYDESSGRHLLFPNVSVRNIYIFPGVPNLMRRMFNAVYKDLFGKGSKKLYKRDVYTCEKEIHITDALNRVVAAYPTVTFGSYPEYFHSYYQVHLTVQSEVEADMHRAYSDLLQALPKGSVVDYDPTPLQDAYHKISQLALSKPNLKISQAVSIILSCLQAFKPHEVCVYVNCEKESTAVLHLLYACVNSLNLNTQLLGFHVAQGTALPEVELYVKETALRYNMKIKWFQESLHTAVLKVLSENPQLKVIMFGCPRIDVPTAVTSRRLLLYRDLTAHRLFLSLCCSQRTQEQRSLLQVASQHSPVVWVNPLQQWESADVWDFIRSLYLPYCSSSYY